MSRGGEHLCATDPAAGCAGLDVVHEVVSVELDASGVFLPAGEDPRAWRGAGCMYCTFENGASSAVCP